jgi:arsenite methyltransferase
MVREAYSAAAQSPAGGHDFPVGRTFAENLGYPPQLLESLPPASVEAFSGVSTVSLIAPIHEGARVLDVGCGAGMDSAIARSRAGPQGRVVGLDFSEQMLARARCTGPEIIFCCAATERMPLADASMDMALVNGIFNLNPLRSRIFHGLARVLRPGGILVAAELILAQPLPPEMPTTADWFA